MYGLKDAARTWNKLLLDTFSECGLKKMSSAPCEFFRKEEVIFCYVDDPVLLANVEDATDALYRQLDNKFRVEDLGKPRHFLRLEHVWHEDGSVLLSQKLLIHRLLEETGIN